MSILRKVARRVRHLPGLEQLGGLWQVLRPAYHLALNAGGDGVEVSVGNCAPVRMPAEFSGGGWERHEPEAVAAYARWIRDHPGALVLDVGCSVGIFSAVALFADPAVEVVAFDSDLPSLAGARRLCSHAPGKRLHLLHGLVAEQPTAALCLTAALSATEEALARSGAGGEAGTTRYVCLTDADRGDIPVYRLDDLFASEPPEGRAVLIKCDVEGAELLVLRGAEAFLRRAAPALLISVHPPTLPDYGHTRADIESFLARLGYRSRVLAVDHEEHWWCEPAPAATPPRTS